MRRLIFLSWAYPPSAFPRAIQVARLARHVRHRPLQVYCAGDADSPPGDTDRVTVERIGPAPAERWLRRVLSPRGQAALLLPDPQRIWAAHAARHILHRAPPGRDDVLVSFGQPMSDHLAGLAIRRRTGVRWIAHFSDPWADNPFARHGWPGRFYNRRLERAVIGATDRVVFVSPETRDLVMAKYPAGWRDKAVVIPHAFDTALYPDEGPGGDAIVLRYIGNFYGKRAPLPLLRALGLLVRETPALTGRIRVELVGQVAPRVLDEQTFRALPAGLLRVVSPVDYATSLTLMRSADVLINIDAPARRSVFLPSKLIDYLGAGRPIVGLSPPGTAADLIAALGGWVADPDDAAAGARALSRAVDFAAAHRGEPWGREDVRRNYNATAVAKMFADLLTQLDSGVEAFRPSEGPCAA